MAPVAFPQCGKMRIIYWVSACSFPPAQLLDETAKHTPVFAPRDSSSSVDFAKPLCMQKRQSLAGQGANATRHFVAAVDLLPGLWVQNHGRQTQLQRRLSAIPCSLYCRHVIHGAEVSLLKNHTA
jgi:hypothetical protein